MLRREIGLRWRILADDEISPQGGDSLRAVAYMSLVVFSDFINIRFISSAKLSIES